MLMSLLNAAAPSKVLYMHAGDGGRDPFADVAVERRGFAVAIDAGFARLIAGRGKGVLEGRDAARIPVLDGAPLGDRSRRGVDDFPRRRVELALGEGLCKGRGEDGGRRERGGGRERERCV